MNTNTHDVFNVGLILCMLIIYQSIRGIRGIRDIRGINVHQ